MYIIYKYINVTFFLTCMRLYLYIHNENTQYNILCEQKQFWDAINRH